MHPKHWVTADLGAGCLYIETVDMPEELPRGWRLWLILAGDQWRYVWKTAF
jgi:hypothetical protein